MFCRCGHCFRNMASKSGMPSPSGKTHVRHGKRQNAIRERDTTIARRPLFNPPNPWIDKEDEALTSFILIRNVADDKWPSVKSAKFWEGASTFIQNMCGTVRTSKMQFFTNSQLPWLSVK